MEQALVGGFADLVGVSAEVVFDMWVAAGIEGLIGGIEDTAGVARVELVGEFAADGVWDECVTAFDHFVEKGLAHGVDVVGGENACGEHVHGLGGACLVVVVRAIFEVVVIPEGGCLDASILDVLHDELLGVDVVHGDEAFDAVFFGDGGDETSHPVVTVNEVGLHCWDDVVDDFALEGEGGSVVLGAVVYFVAVVEDEFFREVNAIFSEAFGKDFILRFEDAAFFFVEHAAIVRKGDVDVCALFVEGFDEGGGDICHAASLCLHALRHVTHASGKVGNFWGDN